jgi:hypothetical protein
MMVMVVMLMNVGARVRVRVRGLVVVAHRYTIIPGFLYAFCVHIGAETRAS